MHSHVVKHKNSGQPADQPRGSINHASEKAATWLKERSVAEELPIADLLSFALRGTEIARQFCRTAGLSLHDVIAASSQTKNPEDGLVRLAKPHTAAIADVCMCIPLPSARYTAKSRSRKGEELLRLVATLARYGDLRIVRPSLYSTPDKTPRTTRVGSSPARFGRVKITAQIPAAADQKSLSDQRQSSCLETTKNSVNSFPTIVEADSLFRSLLGEFTHSATATEHDRLLPCNFGLGLNHIRQICDALLGAVEPRNDVALMFEPATPFWRSCDYHLLPAHNSPQQDVETLPKHENQLNGVVLFPPPQWGSPREAFHDAGLQSYSNAVATIKRKRQRHEGQPIFHYGLLKTINEAILSGESVIVTGISGVGKSTLLSMVRSIATGTVFELGCGADTASKGQHSFRYDQILQLLAKAKRTKGVKILISDELFIDPDVLPQLGLFTQVVFAGDPRQPGPTRRAQHLFDFIRDIDGRSYMLNIVWRAHNSLSIALVNYIMHGSQFKICPPSGSSLQVEDNQFDLVKSGDDPRAIAAAMVTYALAKIKKESHSRKVLIAAQDAEIITNLTDIIDSLHEKPTGLQCRYLHDIQGQETDVLVVDLHDVAESNSDVTDALRYLSMMLGRARYTTCFVLGQRNTGTDRKSALPLEVFIGTILRQRVRQSETSVLEFGGECFKELARI